MTDVFGNLPMEFRERFAEIVELLDVFCEKRLNEEYRDLCRRVAALCCSDGSPILRGRVAGWASGIAHAVGWCNFLHDPTQSPHMKSEEIARSFGVSVGTMQAKSRAIRDGLQMMPLDPEFCLPSRLSSNPLVWIHEINGFLVDFRYEPRSVQEKACELGLIPFVPEETASTD